MGKFSCLLYARPILDSEDMAVNKTWNLQSSGYACNCWINPTEVLLHLHKLDQDNVLFPTPTLCFTFITESWSCKACTEALSNMHAECEERGTWINDHIQRIEDKKVNKTS